MYRFIRSFVLLFGVLVFASVLAQNNSNSEEVSDYDSILNKIQTSIDCDRETAEAFLGLIENFAVKIQAEFTYLASSPDELAIKQKSIKSTIKKYFESENSLVSVSNVNRKPIYDYEVKVYLYRLATLIHYKYTKVELLFDPDYLGISKFERIGPTSFELSVSMWQLFRGWVGYELVYEDATRKKFRLRVHILSSGKVELKISEILVAETIPYERYKSKFKSDQ